MKLFDISTKSKVLIFILILISIILSSINYQNNLAQQNFIKEVETSYVKSFDNYYNSFKKSILKYYSTQATFFTTETIISQIKEENFQALIESTNFIYNNLKETNYYLTNISFIVANAEHLINKNEVFFGDSLKEEYEPLIKLITNKNRNLIDIVLKDNETYFRLLSGVFHNNMLLGVVEFLIDTDIILESKNDFDESLGFIYIKKFEEIFTKYSHFNKQNIFKNLKQEDLKENKVIKIDKRYYVSKFFALNTIQGKNVATSVFFLDITDKKVPYEISLKRSFYLSILLLLISGVLLNLVLNSLVKKLEISQKNYKNLNKKLEQRVKEEINIKMEVLEEKKQKEKMLINQSKLASMGEMIANIAHQWKQPLTQMSTVIMYIEAYQENNKLSEERLFSKTKEATKLISYMSQTIDDFRNFYKPDKQKNIFSLETSLLEALSIIKASLSYNNIIVKLNIENEELTVNGYKNEFSQALLNIISNAKDVLIQRKIKNPYINIIIYKENNNSFITISDNAGGIETDIINKIFNPYFTTKHSSQGTGIGLYMSKMIIETNMQGSVYVKNNEKGACFTIVLSKVKND